MKSIYLLLLVLILTGSTSAQKVKHGFKGFEWGTPYSEMDNTFGLSIDKPDPYGVCYEANVKTIGLIEVDRCWMNFYDSLFSCYQIIVSGRNNSDKLMTSMKLLFGQPKDTFEVRGDTIDYEHTCYTWFHILTRRHLKMYDDSGAMLIAYSYPLVSEKRRSDNRIDGSKIQEDF